MAEIKSTMQMVLERAARMSAQAGEETIDEAALQTGMRLAAAYLNQESSQLLKQLQEQPADKQPAVRSGMLQTLLRNIALPRDEFLLERSMLSLQGLLDLSGGAGDINSICSELRQILEQYQQHQEQVRQQLDQAIRQQLKQMLEQQGQRVTDEMSLNPAMHPQYQEEWNRVLADLNDQYNQALEQRKTAIGQRLGA